jgi:murein DD-endopeptidase MepM/ murein hydrolase activator NlpD
MRRLVLIVLLLLAALLATQPAHAAPRAGFGWPLAGTPTVSRPFQPPASTYGPGHRGVDLAAQVGDAVLAAGPGRVTYAGVLAGRGVVTVTHSGGLRTTYEPVTASVHVGAQVVAGDRIGRLATGHGGCSSCLHWGLLRGDTYLDPLGLLVAPELRLLPVGGPAAPQAVLSSNPPASAGAERGLGAAAAVGSLALGISVLAGRARPGPPQPPSPVDLRAERARRRAA